MNCRESGETELNDKSNGIWISSRINYKARNRPASYEKASWQDSAITFLENISVALILEAVLKMCQS